MANANYYIGRFGEHYPSGDAIHILKNMDLGDPNGNMNGSNCMILPICQGSIKKFQPQAIPIRNATRNQISCKRCLKFLKEHPQMVFTEYNGISE